MHQSSHPIDDPQGPEQHDTAQQALTDALRISFAFLKGILILVVVLYAFSGFEILEQNEQAVVLRLGHFEGVRGPGGLVKSLPRPFDEVIKVPVAEKRIATITTQDIFLKEGESRSTAHRAGGLDPTLDGAVMTGDKGLIHATWVVTYEIADLKRFITNIYEAEKESRRKGSDAGGRPAWQAMIENAVQNAAIAVIGREEAVEVIRSKIADVQESVRRRAQTILDDLGSGITLAAISAQINWPVQTQEAFKQVTEAISQKKKSIDEAEQNRTEWLNKTAGASQRRLEVLFDQHLAARTSGDMSKASDLMAEIEEIILKEATGDAGERIRQAESFKKQVLEDIQGDVQQFRALLSEYQSNPTMLMRRLWYDVQREIFTNPSVTRRQLPAGQKEVRLHISPDPQEAKQRETQAYKKKDLKKGDFGALERRQPIAPLKPLLR